MRIKLLILAFILPLTFCVAQTCKDDFDANPYMAGSGYVAYPGPNGSQTAAPADYEPCCLSLYGRHGSRYLIGDTYNRVYNVLQRAEASDMLTGDGKDLFEKLKKVGEEAAGRNGQLTALGVQQQHEIAERMFNNYPEIFNKLKLTSSDLNMRFDANSQDINNMDEDDPYIAEARKKGVKLLDGFFKDHIHPKQLMRGLFSEISFWKDSIDANKTALDLFEVATSIQNTAQRDSVNISGLFNEDETYDLWQCHNALWYVAYGPSSYSDAIQPYSQRTLLRKMINETDSCMRLDKPGINLHYVDDAMVMPLACLLELDNVSRDIMDLNTLATHEWCDYRITPMAANIQFVFYRSKESRAATSVKDAKGRFILVKVLLNENEARLPIATDTYPYYKWADVKAYYLKKLDAYDAAHPTVNASKWDRRRR